MNAPSLHELREAALREAQDEKMEQIRELLLGDSLTHLNARIAAMESRISEFEIGIARQLDAVEARIDQLANASDRDQREAFDALAGSVAELSERIRNIIKHR